MCERDTTLVTNVLFEMTLATGCGACALASLFTCFVTALVAGLMIGCLVILDILFGLTLGLHHIVTAGVRTFFDRTGAVPGMMTILTGELGMNGMGKGDRVFLGLSSCWSLEQHGFCWCVNSKGTWECIHTDQGRAGQADQ